MSERVREAAKCVLLAFHDWPAHASGFADGERRRALSMLAEALAARPASAYGPEHDAVVRILQSSPDLIADGAVANTSAVALRILDAIARPASAEPVGWGVRDSGGLIAPDVFVGHERQESATRQAAFYDLERAKRAPHTAIPLFTTPPAAAQDRERLASEAVMAAIAETVARCAGLCAAKVPTEEWCIDYAGILAHALNAARARRSEP